MNSTKRPNRKISEYGLVIVTGGSSGIGKTIIERVVKLGPRPRLCNLSRQKPDVFFNDETDLHLECDLSQPAEREKIFQHLQAWIESLGDTGPILLVNNAGFGSYGEVADLPPKSHTDIIEVNITALVSLTTRLLPTIQKHGGTILNVASNAAFQATPFIATYGSTKAFVLNWTLSLNDELKGSPVNALALCPGPTRTEFFDRAGIAADSLPPSAMQTTDQVVDAAFNALAKGKAYVISGLLNKIAAQISCRLPKTLGTAISGRVVRRFRTKP